MDFAIRRKVLGREYGIADQEFVFGTDSYWVGSEVVDGRLQAVMYVLDNSVFVGKIEKHEPVLLVAAHAADTGAGPGAINNAGKRFSIVDRYPSGAGIVPSCK